MRNWFKGNLKSVRVIESSNYLRFELSGVFYEKVLVQGEFEIDLSYWKFELYEVRVMFELTGVRVIGILLYFGTSLRTF